jgi:protein-L-isoaspartate O-methyltransferase
VSAPQLFPTPPHIARQVIELAEIGPGMRVLEPSAGTGALIDAIDSQGKPPVVCVEINHSLAEALRRKHPFTISVTCWDFLRCEVDPPLQGSLEPGTPVLGRYDRIVMNPPFEHGSDIKHIEHARRMLKPGGRLVAICADGPRQQDRLQPHADAWIPLPLNTFNGTVVRAAILVMKGFDFEQVTGGDECTA